MQLDDGARGLGRDAINAADRGPVLRIGRAIDGMFGFGAGDVVQLLDLAVWNIGGHLVPRLILPEHARQRASARHVHVARPANRVKAVELAAAHRERLLKPPVQSVALVVRDNQAAAILRPAPRLEREPRANLVARRVRRPTGWVQIAVRRLGCLLRTQWHEAEQGEDEFEWK